LTGDGHDAGLRRVGRRERDDLRRAVLAGSERESGEGEDAIRHAAQTDERARCMPARAGPYTGLTGPGASPRSCVAGASGCRGSRRVHRLSCTSAHIERTIAALRDRVRVPRSTPVVAPALQVAVGMLDNLKAVLVCVAILVACKSEPKPGPLVTFETACDGLNENLTEKRRATIDGYLGAPKMMLCSDSCSLNLYPTSKLEGDFMGVSFKVGDGANELSKLTNKFSPTDIKVHTNDGKTVGVGAKIRVSGDALGSKKSCSIVGIDLVEAAR
jgi:hypothetical protein